MEGEEPTIAITLVLPVRAYTVDLIAPSMRTNEPSPARSRRAGGEVPRARDPAAGLGGAPNSWIPCIETSTTDTELFGVKTIGGVDHSILRTRFSTWLAPFLAPFCLH
jgi:hypothetical protein